MSVLPWELARLRSVRPSYIQWKEDGLWMTCDCNIYTLDAIYYHTHIYGRHSIHQISHEVIPTNVVWLPAVTIEEYILDQERIMREDWLDLQATKLHAVEHDMLTWRRPAAMLTTVYIFPGNWVILQFSRNEKYYYYSNTNVIYNHHGQYLTLSYKFASTAGWLSRYWNSLISPVPSTLSSISLSLCFSYSIEIITYIVCIHSQQLLHIHPGPYCELKVCW